MSIRKWCRRLFLPKTPDGYRGWISGRIAERKDYQGTHKIGRISAHIYPKADIKYGPMMSLPYGVEIVAEELGERWLKVLLPDGREGFVQRGDVVVEELDIIALSKKFLGLPYTWGGRSSFGFDCSGFVQMLYGKLGLLLPRDAKDQILDTRLMAVEEIKEKDLIFFGESEGKITHVGMSIGGGEFIHASVRENMPYLRISKLTDSVWASGYRCARRKKITG
jgi:hypothetical protein